jgi:hypothetical protein
MFMQITSPVPVQQPSSLCRLFQVGCPAPVVPSPDSLAALTSAETATESQAGFTKPFAGLGDLERERYSWMFYPPPYQFAMGKVRAMSGLGCVAGKPCSCGGKCHGMGQATSDGLLAQVSDAMGTMNLGTWLLVGISAAGLWAFIKDSQKTKRVVKRRKIIKRLEAA